MMQQQQMYQLIKGGTDMDSITKGQRNLLLFILGIAILVVPIRFFAMDNFSQKKDLESQKNERQTYYNELKATDSSI